jgi:WD40 repeat protein
LASEPTPWWVWAVVGVGGFVVVGFAGAITLTVARDSQPAAISNTVVAQLGEEAPAGESAALGGSSDDQAARDEASPDDTHDNDAPPMAAVAGADDTGNQEDAPKEDEAQPYYNAGRGAVEPPNDAPRLQTATRAGGPPPPERKLPSPEAPSRGLALSDAGDPQAPGSHYERSFAVIVGIDQYGGDPLLPELLHAENDAKEFRDLLVSDFGYRLDDVRFLANRDATYPAVRDSLSKWMFERGIQPNDSMLVFFAGHGLIDEQSSEGYLATVESRSDDREKSCVPVTWLRDQLAKLPCRHKLVILDSCYSGLLFTKASSDQGVGGGLVEDGASGGTRGAGARTVDNMQYYLRNPAFLGISAGRLTVVADGLGENRHSVFTSSLLEVMKERANSPRPDHAFTFRALAQQVEQRVASALGSRQIPDWGRLGDGDGDFIFRESQRRDTPREVSQNRQRAILHQQYVDAVHEARRAEQGGQIARARQLLDRITDDGVPADMLGWEYSFLQALCRKLPIRELPNPASTIGCIDWSQDGSRLLTCDIGGQIRTWDVAAGRELMNVPAELSARFNVRSVAWSPDSKEIVGGDGTGRLLIWNADTGDLLRTLGDETSGGGHTKAVSFLHFRREGRLLASGGGDGRVIIWDYAKHKLLRQLEGHTGPVLHVCWHPNENRIASASTDETVRVWNAANGQQLLRFDAHREALRKVAWSGDGHYVASVGNGSGTLKIWDPMDGAEVASFPNLGAVTSLSWHPTSNRVMVGTPDGHLVFDECSPPETGAWVTESREGIASIACVRKRGFVGGRPIAGQLMTVSWSPDGNQFAVGLLDGRLNIWERHGIDRHMSIDPVPTPLPSVGEESMAIAWNPRSALLAVGTRDAFVLWDIEANRIVKSLHWPNGAAGLPSSSIGLSFAKLNWSPDGHRLCCTRYNSRTNNVEAAIWDASTGEIIISMPGERGHSHASDWSPDGRYIAVVANNSKKGADLKSGPSGRLVIYDAGSAQQVAIVAAQAGSVMDVKWSPDAQRVATVSLENGVRIWGWAERKLSLQNEISCSGTSCVTWGPEGKQLAAGGTGRKVQVWDARTGRLINELQHTYDVSAVEWSPDGRRIASLGRELRIWDPTYGDQLFEGRGLVRIGSRQLSWSVDCQKLAIVEGANVVVLDAAPKSRKSTD